MKTKTESEQFAKIMLISTSILLCCVGLSLGLSVIIWRLISLDSHTLDLSESSKILNSISGFFGILSAAFSFAGLIIGFLNQNISEKICRKLNY